MKGTPNDALNCPQCGAAARPDEADAFATCRFCGARLLLGAEPGIRHDVLLAALPAGDVPARLRQWLTDREAVGRPTDVSLRLVFFPFWVSEGRQGSVLAPAAALLSEGLASFRLPAGDVKSFDAEAQPREAVVPATIAKDAISFGEVPVSELRLVHVPFFDVSFQLFARPCRVLLDAVAGQALPLVAIPTSEAALDRAYAVLLAVLFGIAFAGFHFVFRGLLARGAVLLLVAGPLVVLVTREIVVRMEET